MNLFDNSNELQRMLRRLELGGDDVGRILRARLVQQRQDLPKLGRFARLLDSARYDRAMELIDCVAARLIPTESLEAHLLALECDFVKLASRSQRSRSGKRFEKFWGEFDHSIKRHICVTAQTAYDYAAARSPPPHPKLSTVGIRFREVKRNL